MNSLLKLAVEAHGIQRPDQARLRACAGAVHFRTFRGHPLEWTTAPQQKIDWFLTEDLVMGAMGWRGMLSVLAPIFTPSLATKSGEPFNSLMAYERTWTRFLAGRLP